jgi:hypothetical protein
MNYVVLPHNKKLNLLRAHDGEWPDLDQVKWCLHCGGSFTGHQVRVWQDEAGRLWLECGTPNCDGSPIDWADYPWWDEKRRPTRSQVKRRRKPKPGRGKKSDDANDIPF